MIAIDTSGSCERDGSGVSLERRIPDSQHKENFFEKMKVYLIQCDCCIQEQVMIHSEEEWETYREKMAIQGRGGTDFRPVFEDVEGCRRKENSAT